MVADNDSGKSVMSQVRTSSGTFLAKHEVKASDYSFYSEKNRVTISELKDYSGIRMVICLSSF